MGLPMTPEQEQIKKLTQLAEKQAQTIAFLQSKLADKKSKKE